MTIDGAAVHELLGRWWFNYDEGNFDVLAELLTDDAHFTCRTDTGTTDYEEFVRSDLRGRAEVMAWQTDHRINSPYPLRHNAANVHVVEERGDEATFASYIFVTQIVEGVAPLSTGIVTGTVRSEPGGLRIAELNVVLDTNDVRRVQPTWRWIRATALLASIHRSRDAIFGSPIGSLWSAGEGHGEVAEAGGEGDECRASRPEAISGLPWVVSAQPDEQRAHS